MKRAVFVAIALTTACHAQPPPEEDSQVGITIGRPASGTSAPCPDGDRPLLAPAALATTPTSCTFNPCDPYCRVYLDTAPGVDGGGSFTSGDGGLGLASADAGAAASACASLSPLSDVAMTVTSLSPVTTSPASASFTTALVPAGCLPGAFAPLWGASRYDLGVVSAGGAYTHVVPVPANVAVTAYAGSLSVSANVAVTVLVNDVSAAPSGFNVASFSGAASSTEAAPAFLYPYDGTIFPLGLSAPLVMWKRAAGTAAAKAVRVTLKFPATGTSTFRWTAIVAEGSERFQIPQSAWTAFDQTAKGSLGAIEIQRIDSKSKLQSATTIGVRFATANLRGRIYYTNYASTADVKRVLPFGNAAPTSAFTPPIAKNCGVCHTFSASGNKFVTSSHGDAATLGYNTFGISNVQVNGDLAALHAGPAGSGDSRGLAFAAVTRDGTYALLANNWWGNPNNGSNATTAGSAGAAFKVFRLPTTPGAATDVTASGFGGASNAWGLGGATPIQMYTPAFSPDDKRLVYVNGDATGDASDAKAASRQGVSTLEFDEATKRFSNRRLIVKTTTGTARYVRWPMWELDSRSVIYQSAATNDDDGFDWYAGMLPSGCCGRKKVRGELWSVDATAASPTPVSLTEINKGLGASSPLGTDDTNRTYQPTMLGVAAGGYRWAVLTSVRAWGNMLNTGTGALSTMTNKLWVAAIDDTPSGAVDRSHPPFFLPNQDASASVLNERGYWALEACKPADVASSVCASSEDCCGYNPAAPGSSSAMCLVDAPLTSPPTFHCKSTSAASCRALTETCTSDSSCCGFPTTRCVNGACQNPPPIAKHTAASFIRDYSAECTTGKRLAWRAFEYRSTFPAAPGASIAFSAATAATQSGLASAVPVPLGTQTATNASWVGVDVDPRFRAATPRQTSKAWLRVVMAFTPAVGGAGTPLLTDWRQSFDCVDAE
ncbi:MAG: hypothetical protein KF819_08690 [Labilithrix sp.]|nr:hypothetical protein [Labilithrix sp.]